MKLRLLMSLMFVLTLSANASALDVKFADTAWDGVKVPEGQQCQKFGGINPATPAWIVSDIPADADVIVLEYSDRDSKKMDNGGHGVMSFKIDSPAEIVEIPVVPGHTFEIPAEFTMIQAHRGAGWDIEGAYMPPCSGGNDHAYYVTVKVVKDGEVTAETIVEMGKY